MSHVPIVKVCCAILRRKDTYLLVQRPLHKADGGLWEFPGGKIEPGETSECCIRREIDEELGLQIRLCGILAPVRLAKGAATLELLPFLAVIEAGALQLREHLAERWLPLGAINSADLCEADRPILAVLAEAGLEETLWWR